MLSIEPLVSGDSNIITIIYGMHYYDMQFHAFTNEDPMVYRSLTLDNYYFYIGCNGQTQNNSFHKNVIATIFYRRFSYKVEI